MLDKVKFYEVIRYFVFALLGIFFIVVLKHAWMGDDAFIGMRTVDNFVNGFGLRWNIAERVQVFTSPLWLLLISFFYFFTNEPFFTVMVVSIMITMLAVFIFSFKFQKPNFNVLVGLLLLLSSRAFMDYTTSGLETPLSYLLFIVWMFWILKKHTDLPTKREVINLGFLTSLILLTRLDFGLIVAPYYLYRLWKFPELKTKVIAAIMGLSPIILWELFSVIYYGSPLPNTYYAKLNTGLNLANYVKQGFIYYLDLLLHDPITLLIIGVALSLEIVIFYKNRLITKRLVVTLGISLYLLYIIKIGGDFMAGRFFVIPFLLSVMLLSHRAKLTIAKNWWILVAIIFYTFINVSSPLLSDGNYHMRPHFRASNIADERAFYYRGNALLGVLRGENVPNHEWVQDGKKIKESGVSITQEGTVGMRGYYAGPEVHIVDYFAIGDRFLANLPSKTSNWRIGHFKRDLPTGYLESIETSTNQIIDADLKKDYAEIRLLTRADLFTPERLRTIMRYHLGF